MKLVLALAALAGVCLAGQQALGDGALSYPMAAHVAAQYGIQHPGLPPDVLRYQEVKHGGYSHAGRQRYRGHYYGRGYYGGYGPRTLYPPLWGPPGGFVPYPAYPPIYRPGPYDCWPYRGFRYYGPGLSIGVTF